MPSESADPLPALYHIRDNIVRARMFVADYDFERFRADLRTFYAATRALEIISEASRRLPEEIRARNPHIPWRAIRDAGNFYRHQYDNVLESFVWRTIYDSFPALLAVVEHELQRLGEPI